MLWDQRCISRIIVQYSLSPQDLTPYLRIFPSGASTPKRIIRGTYIEPANELRFTTEDINNHQTIYDLPLVHYISRFDSFIISTKTGLMNKQMTISISVDLSAPLAKFSVNAGDFFWAPAVLTSMSYDPDWIFDHTTLLTICSDYDGSSAAICGVQNLKVLYKITGFPEILPFSNPGNQQYRLSESC